MNRLLSKTADPFFSQGACANGACGATQVSYTYTPTGKRASMTDASGMTTYSYDFRVNRPQVKSTPIADVNYGWDLAGNQVSLLAVGVNGGASMSYTYDADNRLASVTDSAGLTTNYTYDAVGNLSSFAYPNGVSTSYTYNPLNRLTNMQSVCGTTAPGCGTAGAAIASYTYTLGAAGNRLSVVELSGRNVNYGYDDLYRLTSESIAGTSAQNGNINYQYDPVGNRKQLSSTVSAIPSGLLNYDANDRLSTDLYDNNGNTINNGGIGNIYDFENHLVQRGNVFIVYDGDGNRVSETVAGVTTNYLVADVNPTGYPQVIDEIPNHVPGTGVVSNRSYTYGLERINQKHLARIGTTNVFVPNYYGYDGHGSVRFLTDATGAITDTYDYDAFGNLISSTGTTPNNYLFAGEQFDSALGIYYNRARYYDERSGRFWSMDEYEGISFESISLHKYLYASANPTNNLDPSGLLVEEPLIAQNEENSIGAEEDAAALRIFQTAFRRSLYAGKELVSSTPTLLLRAAAALFALVFASSAILGTLSVVQPGEMPDAAAAHQAIDERNGQTSITLFRDIDSAKPREFRWRGPEKDPDGLSFFEKPFQNPQPKGFSVGFKALYAGEHRDGVLGGFVEPELYGIGVVYTPNIGAGDLHWSAPITTETAKSYEDRFAEAAERIRRDGGFLSNPVPKQ